MASLAAVDDAFGGDETISEGCFAVVDVGNDGDVSYSAGVLQQGLDVFISSLLPYHR
jgi:hypothetical protein